MFSKPRKSWRSSRSEDVKFVDVRFCDLPGVMQHFNVPPRLAGRRLLHRRPDVRRVLDPRLPGHPRVGHEAASRTSTTAYLDPFRVEKTLNINFRIVDPYTDEPYSRDPRQVAAKAEAYLKSTGIADTAFFAPEAEFYIFDDVRFETKPERVATTTSTPSRPRGTPAARRRVATSATRPPTRAATSPSRRSTTSPTCATRSCLQLDAARPRASSARTTRSAPPARRRSTTASTRSPSPADKVMLFKYVVKNVAHEAGKTATFMPKPLFGDNGSGMHVPPVPLEGRRAAVLRREGLRRPVRHGALVHRRPAQARARRCSRSPTRR